MKSAFHIQCFPLAYTGLVRVCVPFVIVMIYLLTLYRFNEVENRNGYPQADEHSKTAFSVVE